MSGATKRSTGVLAGLGLALLLAAGTLTLGRVSDDATLSMGLTTAWWAALFAAAALLARRDRRLAVPLALGYGAAAAAAFVLLVLPTLRDREVNERVATGPRLASGEFRSLAHSGTGTAAVVRPAAGGRKLTLTNFETDSGPDLRVYVSTSDPASGDLGEFKDLGALKGNVGNQQYALPADLDLGRYSTVVVWCRAFSVAFTSARLERA